MGVSGQYWRLRVTVGGLGFGLDNKVIVLLGLVLWFSGLIFLQISWILDRGTVDVSLPLAQC